METTEILGKIGSIFVKILASENIALFMDTTANDIEGWDSLTHIQLIVAVEKHFNIRFTSLEIMNFKNVGDMCRLVQFRINPDG